MSTVSCESPQYLKEDLRALLDQDPAAVSRRMREKYDRLTHERGASIVLCGAGVVGRLALEGLRRAGIEPKAFADNNASKWNTTIEGLPVLSPGDAAREFGGECAFVVTIYHGRAVREQFSALGCSVVVPFDCLFLKYADVLLPHMSLDLPHEIFRQAKQVEQAFELWADDQSRIEYIAQLKYRTSLDSQWTREHDPAEDTYFPQSLTRLSGNEVFADCGAFDGDSLLEFLQRSGGRFRKAIAIEPDGGTYRRLQQFVASLPPDTRERVQALNLALGRARETVFFAATGTVYSRISESGVEVSCEALDNLLAGCEDVYLKMDIEGAELDALEGASQLLAEGSATLAICNHHTQDDLWRVPLAIHERSGGRYRLYLRRYAEDCWENMCHAIPRVRLERDGA